MPTSFRYRVVSCPTDQIIDQLDAERNRMYANSYSAIETDVTSTDVSGAENLVLIQHPDHTIIQCRLIGPEVTLTVADLATLLQDYFLGIGWDYSDITDFAGYVHSDLAQFLSVVQDVATALRDSCTCQHLHVVYEGLPEGGIDYAMISRSEPHSLGYRTIGCDLKELTDDRAARGIDALVAIATCLVRNYNQLR